MLRSIPSTPLVCLVIFLSTIFLNASWAATPDESLDILLKPNQGVSVPGPTVHKAKSRGTMGMAGAAPAVVMYPPPLPLGITKVKPPAVCGPVAGPFPGCILPKPRPGQWEMGIAAIFARTRGIVAWPRYTPYLAWGQNNEIDLNALGLPAHWTVPEFTARYQFRPNWAIRYSVLGWDFSGGTDSFQGGNNWGGVTYFGWIPLTWGLQLQSKWQHTYQTLSLVYDAVNTCNSSLSVYAGWVHAEDKISVNCTYCGWWTGIFSKGGDSALVGLQLQQCVRTAPNGGTFSLDNKAAVIFGDDVQGWDIALGGRYSIPLNCGRSGYAKGGYRFVDYKKNQQDFILTNAIEGGFVEFGFIF